LKRALLDFNLILLAVTHHPQHECISLVSNDLLDLVVETPSTLVLFLLLLYHSLQLCLQLQNPLPILAHVDTQPEPEAKGRLCLQMLLLPRLLCEPAMAHVLR
jgi:hypothetical protein